MMKTQMTIILLLVAGITCGQKYFKALPKSNPSSNYEILVPIFEHESFDTTGKKGAVYLFMDTEYLKTIFNRSLRSVLPLDSINKLETMYHPRTNSMVSIIIDPTGKLWDIVFAIPTKDRKILTDEVLYQLYHKIREVRIDMSKIEINSICAAKIRDSYGKQTLSLYWWIDKGKKKK